MRSVVQLVRRNLKAVVTSASLPPHLLRDGVLDPAHGAVAHRDVDAAGVSAARGRLLEGARLPGPHAAHRIVDRAFAIIGVVVGVVRAGAVPGVTGADDARSGEAQSPGAAWVSETQMGAGA